jgi:hypothetical protein
MYHKTGERAKNSESYFISLYAHKQPLPDRGNRDYKLKFYAYFCYKDGPSPILVDKLKKIESRFIPEKIVETFPSREIQPFPTVPMGQASQKITRLFELTATKLCASFAIYVIGEYAVLRNYHPAGGVPDLFKSMPKSMVADHLKKLGVKFATLKYIEEHNISIEDEIASAKAKNEFYPIDWVVGHFSAGRGNGAFGPPILESPWQ